MGIEVRLKLDDELSKDVEDIKKSKEDATGIQQKKNKVVEYLLREGVRIEKTRKR